MDLGTGVIKFIGLNGLTAVAALALASRSALPSRAERLLAAAVWFVGLALATGLLLGLSGYLRFWPLLLAQAAVAAPAAAVARWDLIIDAIGALRPARLFAGTPQRLAAAAVALAYLYVVFLGLVTEPFAGDALMYHLPIVAAYAQEGRIVVPQLGRYWNTDLWAYYPGNAYVLYQWWVLPFGSGVLVDLVQWPCAFAAALATFVLARRLGARRRGAVWSALLFVAVPIVINQSKTALVDVTVSFLFAAGLALLVGTPLTRARLLLGAIAWGALPGAKLAALVYPPLGFACVAVGLAGETGWRTLPRRLVPLAAALAAGTLLLSGYWFARNAWLTGSPIFPLNLDWGTGVSWSNIVFYGPIMPLLDFTGYELMFFYNYETGAGVQFASLALPASAALAVWALRNRRFGPAAVAILAVGAYPFWALRQSMSLHTVFRYVLPAMPLGFAAVGWWMRHAPRPRWLVGLAAFSVAFSIVNALPHVGSFVRPESIRFGVGQVALGITTMGRFGRMGDLVVQDFRRAWWYLDRLPGPHRIAASHLIFTYPMLGPDLRHRVYFLEAADRVQWLEEIGARRIDRVALAQLAHPNNRVEVTDGQLRVDLLVANTGDEYVVAEGRVTPQPIRGLRLRYTVPAPANARVRLGINGCSETVELPVDEPEARVDWSGDLKSVELVLEFVRHGSLRDRLALNVSSLDVVQPNGETVALPLRAEQWSRGVWPIEYYWMENDPARFRLALSDRDLWSTGHPSEMRIYEVIE